jgi:hypothetical protein
MWPTIFEFSWDTGHMIFFGVFYAVLITITTSIVYAVAKSMVDTFNGNGDVHPGHAERPEDKGKAARNV